MICDKWLHVYGNKLGTGVNCEWVDDVRENVKGVWVHDSIKGTVCSVCGSIRRDNRIEHTNFCNVCGADMRSKS